MTDVELAVLACLNAGVYGVITDPVTVSEEWLEEVDAVSESFAPSVLLPDGTAYEPKGYEWLLAFAMAGCTWAETALESPEVRAQLLRDRDPITTLWGPL